MPIYLVGGGAFLAPSSLEGISRIHRFPHYECANAVGAAIAQISGVLDVVKSLTIKSVKEIREKVEAGAIQRAVEAGALANTVKIVESDVFPVAYTTDRCRFFCKAAGEWSGTHPADSAAYSLDEENSHSGTRADQPVNGGSATLRADPVWTPTDVLAYRPNVISGEWLLSELDLEFIAIGTFILGCGGGGDPHQSLLAGRELLRSGSTIRVVDYKALDPQTLAGWGGSFGSPEVISERLVGQE